MAAGELAGLGFGVVNETVVDVVGGAVVAGGGGKYTILQSARAAITARIRPSTHT
jgi:hypothetical protein